MSRYRVCRFSLVAPLNRSACEGRCHAPTTRTATKTGLTETRTPDDQLDAIFDEIVTRL
ncbi:hypothetical protein F3X89_16280 [Rhizobium rhizogenes]|nr:hypothetical protein F3X89_16280 [Rhizobium rhizogenes]